MKRLGIVPTFALRATAGSHRVGDAISLKLALNSDASEGDGGEGGIRTRQDPFDSVSYRFYNAAIAVDASGAVAPCTRLPPRPSFEWDTASVAFA